jgi:ankyrin repeat protein
MRQVDVNVRTHDGSTALHLALGSKNVAIAQYLVWHEADVSVRDGDGLTALDHAWSVNVRDVLLKKIKRDEHGDYITIGE